MKERLFILLSLVCACCDGRSTRQEAFTLTVVHVNDIHAHFEQINEQARDI